MSKNTNPREPRRGTDAGRSPAGIAKKKLRNAARRYLEGISSEDQYRDTWQRLTSVIVAGGLELPDVPSPLSPEP